MLHNDMKLGSQAQKLIRDATLLQNEKCIITAKAGSLTVPILVDNVSYGHLFLGKGQFILDAIIETPRGAVGESTVKDLAQPFLMLSRSIDLNPDITSATIQDLADNGYPSLEEFLRSANYEFDQSAPKRGICFSDNSDAHFFAFKTERNKWDILIAKEDRLVYRAADKVYISKNQDGIIVTSPTQVLIARRGKTVAIDKGDILIDRGRHAQDSFS